MLSNVGANGNSTAFDFLKGLYGVIYSWDNWVLVNQAFGLWIKLIYISFRNETVIRIETYANISPILTQNECIGLATSSWICLHTICN